MIKTIVKNVLLKDVTVEANVRLPQDNLALSQDIEERGLTTKPLVWDRDGTLVVLRGHRRFDALQMFYQRDASGFDVMFPKGIEVEIIKDISANEANDLKVDHGNERSLDHPHELQMSASMLFDADKSERAVVVQLAGLMDRLHPMSSKAKLDHAALIEAADAVTGDRAIIAQNEVEKFLFNYRRGLVQGLNNAHRSPSIVMDALWFKATGTNPEGYAGRELISLTNNNVSALYKAYKADLEILENGVSKYTRVIPGPLFWEAWDKIAASNAKRAADKASGKTAAKAKSATDLKEEASRWTSHGFRTMCGYHAGDKSLVDSLPAADKLLLMAETLAEKSPDAWAECVAEAETLIAMQIEADTKNGVPANQEA